MHSFNLEIFKSLYDEKKSDNDIIEYIKNCSDKEIIIKNINGNYHNKFLFGKNFDIDMELVKKKFECNNYKIINKIILNGYISTDKIISAVEIYKNNNWLEEDYNILGNLLRIYDYFIELYEYLNLHP